MQSRGRSGRNVSVVNKRQPFLNARLQGFGATIFAEMSALALQTNAVNLGQGFPDKDGPNEVIDAATAAGIPYPIEPQVLPISLEGLPKLRNL